MGGTPSHPITRHGVLLRPQGCHAPLLKRPDANLVACYEGDTRCGEMATRLGDELRACGVDLEGWAL